MLDSHHKVALARTWLEPCKTASPEMGAAPLWEIASHWIAIRWEALFPDQGAVCDPTEASQLLQQRIKDQPHVKPASLESLGLERHPIRPGGGMDHLSADSCFRNTY